MTTTRVSMTALLTAAVAVAALGVGVPQAGAAGAGSDGAPWPGGKVRTVGKLVAKLGGGEAELCSGAVVDSPNGSVVATAAHCVHSPEQPKEPEAMYFQPGYEKGGGPEAVMEKGWKVTSWKTAPGWDVHKPLKRVLPHDWAFLKIEKKGGKTVQEANGANRLQFEPVKSGATTTLGYPVAAPYDGETLHYCRGRAHVYEKGEIADANVGALALKPCKLTQGVSGGPWLRGYDAENQAGTLVGVTSVGGDGELLGRPYPRAAKSVFVKVGAR